MYLCGGAAEHRLDPRVVVVGVDDAGAVDLGAGRVGELQADTYPCQRGPAHRHVPEERTA